MIDMTDNGFYIVIALIEIIPATIAIAYFIRKEANKG